MYKSQGGEADYIEAFNIENDKATSAQMRHDFAVAGDHDLESIISAHGNENCWPCLAATYPPTAAGQDDGFDSAGFRKTLTTYYDACHEFGVELSEVRALMFMQIVS